jgi:hypothetical protein
MLVSIGTGSVFHPLPRADLFGKSLLTNARTIPTTLMASISIENDINCRMIGRCVHGSELDGELGTLVPEDTLPSPRQFLYARYNPDITQSGLSALGLGDIDGSKLRIDNIAAIPDLIRIGQKAAEAVDLPRQFAPFMPSTASPSYSAA